MCPFRALGCVALLFSISMAARMKIEVHEVHSDPKEEPAAVTVCEDDEIWGKIMASPDVASIRAIPWKEITDSIVNYLNDEDLVISSLKAEIATLTAAIDEKKKSEEAEVLGDEQIQELITGSVAVEGSFGSVEIAKSTACGKPGKRPRLPFDAEDVAVDGMVALARPLLSKGEMKSSSQKFLAVCKSFLEAGEDELANYCGQTCSRMSAAVQGVSDQHANSKKSTAKLEKKLAESNKKLLDAKSRRGQCHQSKTNIESFQLYLETLDKDINVKHAAVRKAELDLDNAQWALEELQQQLKDQQQLVSEAADLLTGQQATVQEAREALAAVKKDEDQFIEQIGAAKNLINELREQLSDMKKANEAILDIKKYVSATALKMGYYVDVAVREPVRDIGLVEETSVWDYFAEDVSSEQCSASFKEQLKDFHAYCTGPAMAAFEKMKHYVDLTPLCKLDDESKIAAEEDTAVQARIGFLTEDLQGVQSWLDPFKGTDMTVEKENKKVELGEPEGLRQVMGVYGKIKFYTEYMKEWKIGKGKFHDLLSQLKDKTKSLEADIMKEEDVLQQLKDALEVTSKDKQDAVQKLDVALADEQAALANKNELEKIMSSLTKDIEEAKNKLTDLEELLKHALQMYRDAREKLVSEHGVGKEALAMGQVHEKVLSD